MVSFYRRLDSSVITSLIRLADKGEKSWVVGRKKHVKKLHIIRTRLALKKKNVEKHLFAVFYKEIESCIRCFVQIHFCMHAVIITKNHNQSKQFSKGKKKLIVGQ